MTNSRKAAGNLKKPGEEGKGDEKESQKFLYKKFTKKIQVIDKL